MMRSCPNCYEKWAFKEAKKAGWRFWTGVRKLAEQRGTRHWRVLHCVVSMIDRGVQLTTYREQIYRVTKAHGLDGGLTIFHPFRQNEDMDFLPDGYVHFHVLAIAFGDVRGGSRGTGYVFKVIRDPDSPADKPRYRGLRSWWDARRCIKYQLTHCGIIKGRHALTWWGCLSYTGVSQNQLIAEYPKAWAEMTKKIMPKCPKCGSRETTSLDHEFNYTRWETCGSEASVKDWWRKEKLRRELSDRTVELLSSTTPGCYAPEY
jgi:hypothetical protein